MQAYLVDVTILIALFDENHQAHELVTSWFTENESATLVTCALVENGFLRIFGSPQYPNGPGNPTDALLPLLGLRFRPNFRFLDDSISLSDYEDDLLHDYPTSKQLTDYYLLQLAKKEELTLLTLDRKIPISIWNHLADHVEFI